MLFVYREEYYTNFSKPKEASIEAGDSPAEVAAFEDWQRAMSRVHGIAEVVVAKSRHGSTGTIPVKFHAQITRFSDLAEDARMPTRME